MVHAPTVSPSRSKPEGATGAAATTAGVDTRSRTEIEAEETAREIAEAIGGFEVHTLEPDYLEHERERHASMALGWEKPVEKASDPLAEAEPLAEDAADAAAAINPEETKEVLSSAALSFLPSDAYGSHHMGSFGGVFHPGGVDVAAGEEQLRLHYEQQLRLQQQMAALYAGGHGSPEGVAALTEFHNEFHSRQEELSFLRSLGWEEGDVGQSPR